MALAGDHAGRDGSVVAAWAALGRGGSVAFLEFADVFRKSYEHAIEGKKPDAAWLGDPTDRHESRYWDGEHWTEWVADQGQQATDAVDLGQDAATWNERFENATIAAWRLPVLTERFGVTELELRAIAEQVVEAARLLHGFPLAAVDVARVDKAVRLIRTPDEQLPGKLDRTERAALLNRLYPALLDAGLAVALVHCARCRAVCSLTYDAKGKCYRCPAQHLFVVGDVRVAANDDADRVRAELAAAPPRKGGRPLF
jgi:hypothetical protein